MMNLSKLQNLFCAAFFALLCLAPIAARAESEGVVRYGVTPASLQNDFFEDNNDDNKSYNEQGYFPTRLTGYLSGNSVRYFTRWVKNTEGIGWRGRYGLTLAEFDQYNALYRREDFYMIDVSGYQTPNGVRYAGLWYKNTKDVNWTSYRNLTKDQMQTLHDTIGQNGWRPHRIEGYAVNGQSYFVSLWYYLPGAHYIWHSKLTKEQYADKFEEYKSQGFAPFHIDSHAVGHDVYFSGIWKPVNSGNWVRTDRTWNVFQRYYNNYWAKGYNIDNFYAAETPDGVRYGGIWFFDGVPQIDDNSSLYLRLRKEISEAPARGGAAVLNLTTDQSTMLYADQTFAVASVIKIGILYSLLREVDAGEISLNDNLNSGAVYGSNQSNWLTPNTNYTVLQMAQFMIRSSNNWATNRLIDLLARDGKSGFEIVNDYMSDPAGLNLSVTRLNRYMLGGPSVAGNGSASGDRLAGIECFSTPREMVTLLRRVWTEPLLQPISRLTFWGTLKMDGNNDGVNAKNYIPKVVTPTAYPDSTIFNKDGSLGSPRIVKADAGVMVFPNNSVVFYAVFMDEISDSPDEPGVDNNGSENAATKFLQNAGVQIANEYD